MNPPCDTAGALVTKTRALLLRDKRSIPELFRETGIPFYWLKKFHAGAIQNPNVNRVEALYRALSGKKLQLR